MNQYIVAARLLGVSKKTLDKIEAISHASKLSIPIRYSLTADTSLLLHQPTHGIYEVIFVNRNYSFRDPNFLRTKDFEEAKDNILERIIKELV